MKIFGETTDNFGVKCHTAVHVKSGQSVSLSHSHMITGTNRHSGKTYARWVLDNRYGFWSTKKGTIVPFFRQGKTFSSPSPTFGLLDHISQKQSERLFVENVIGQFGVKSFKDIYPIAELKKITHHADIPPTLISDTRATDIMDFTRRSFGVKNYRRDLVKAVAVAGIQIIAVAKEFKNLVPIDWIIRFLNEADVSSHTYGDFKCLREILLKIDSHSYRRMLFREFNNQDSLLLQNLLRQYRSSQKRIEMGRGGFIDIPNESFSSFTDLHDRLIGHRGTGLYQTKPYINEPITLTKIAKSLQGTKLDDIGVTTATETDALISWGKLMSNCIGGYSHQALSGSDTFGAVYVNEELMANFQIAKSGRLVQLLGRFNKTLDDDLRSRIVDILKSHGVVIPDYYMGGPVNDDLHAHFDLADVGEDFNLFDQWAQPNPLPEGAPIANVPVAEMLDPIAFPVVAPTRRGIVTI